MMNALFGLDDRFMDRRGSGDELYMDSRLKASWLLSELGDMDEYDDSAFDDESDDDAAYA